MSKDEPYLTPFLWPWRMAWQLGEIGFKALDDSLPRDAPKRPLRWLTEGEVVLDLPGMRLHRFGQGEGRPAILVAPYAVHGPVFIDLAHGHSLVEALLRGGIGRLFLVEWKSATPAMRFVSIDDQLALLSAVVGDMGEPPVLIGLCQGGWLSLMFATRFPRRVARLVLAGSPVDLDAGPSALVEFTRKVTPDAVERAVRMGGGVVSGDVLLSFWLSLGVEQAAPGEVLQTERVPDDLAARYHEWFRQTLDLPGTYYVQVFESLYRRNSLARGEFMALGRRLDLSDMTAPVYLIAAEKDEVAPVPQVMATARLVGTPPQDVRTRVVGGGHLSIFVGARNLVEVWSDVARWAQEG